MSVKYIDRSFQIDIPPNKLQQLKTDEQILYK